MKNTTIAKFNEYKNNLDADKGTGVYYSHDFEKVENILKQGIGKNAFLRLITVKFVDDIHNKAYELSLPLVSTTDIEKHERTPKNYIQGNVPFECKQINLDVNLPYADLDKFAEVDFEQAINNELGAEFSQNLVMIGFHGKQRANDSDPEQNPLGQDVAKGWIAQLKEHNQTLDASAHQGKNTNALIQLALEKLPLKLRESGALVAICGANVMPNARVNIGHDDLKNGTHNNVMPVQTLMGGLKAVNVSYFPRNGILITPLANLALYFTKNTSRLFFINRPERNVEEVYFSTSLDFLLENHRHAVYIDGLEVAE
ncbi:P2 family phage major capsid protein [Aggregatibacter sp. Marseille-P9115]|jgi:DNA polymerase III, delta subunit|uniref:P2 family phage major capsid protein n=1 Tax=Aggregatibacter sp. Marseille-P9115 TaxID=2866570 RepID=UPI001E38FD8D|nr:P2 family phage major capsid protein [Aggregatibacter sp. Marseille-P9115]DAP90666.1 MAG TPA: major capsid protein [Caudoviricetes sp.]